MRKALADLNDLMVSEFASVRTEQRIAAAENRAGFAEVRAAIAETRSQVDRVDRKADILVDALADFRATYDRHVHE